MADRKLANQQSPAAAPGRAGGGGGGRRRIHGLIWLTAWLVALLVQVPGLGTVDSARRLQVTRSWGTDEPPVRREDRNNFGVPGRDGTWHAWYGPGQSVLMLPADLVARVAERWIANPAMKLKAASAVVATLTFPPLVATSILLAFLWLGQLGFLPMERWLGAMSLLLASSHLYYTQIHMENSLQVFLLLLDAVCLGRWLSTQRSVWLAVAAGTVAYSLNIRVPALADHGGLWLAMFAVRMAGAPGRIGMRDRWRLLLPGTLFRVALPVVLLGVLADRLYQWQRFGKWTGSYFGEFSRHVRTRILTLSPAFPFDGNFWEGFWGPLISPARGVLFSDPLVWLLLVVVFAHWRRLSLPLRTVVVGLTLGFFALVLFYARLNFWGGSISWGNRYTLTPIHGLTVLILPLILRYGAPENGLRRFGLPFVVMAAVVIQFASILLPSAVEGSQADAEVGPLITLARYDNAIHVLAGAPAPPGVNPEDWRLNLVPGSLGVLFPRMKLIFWLAWFGGLAAAAGLAIRTHRRIRAWDATVDEYDDPQTADWQAVGNWSGAQLAPPAPGTGLG